MTIMTDEDEINFILGNDDGTLFGNIDGDLPEDGELQLEPPSAPVGIIDDFQWHPAAEPADNGGLAFLQSHLLRSDHGAIADIVPLPQEHRVDRVAIYPDFSPRYNENGMKTKRMNVVTPPQDNSERWISLPSNWQQHAGPPPQDLFEAIQFDPNSVDEWFGATPLQEQAVVDNGTSNSSNIHKNQPSRSNMLNHDNNCLAQQLRQIPLIQTMQSESHEQQKEFTKMGQQHLENPYLCNFPPIIHPPQLKQISPTIVPLRKRKLRDSTNRQQEPSHKKLAAVRGRGEKAKNGSTLADDAVVGVIPPEVKAKNARSARKLRRLARAKSHVIHLVGGGDVTKIQRHAVKDSCLDNATTPVSKTATSSLQSASLLNYFFNNDFQPAMFVDMTLEWVQQTLSTEAAISGVHPKKGNEAAPIEAGSRTMDQGKGSELTSNLHPSTPFPKLQPMETPSSFGTCVLMNTPPRNKPAQATASATPKQASRGSANIVTPIKKRNKSSTTTEESENPLHKALPTGKDPESRRLRRLMRNRLSAQASRDRRKKAIADAIGLIVEKKQEIAQLEATMKEETQRMILLEKAVSFAKEYLGEDGFAIVAGGSHPR